MSNQRFSNSYLVTSPAPDWLQPVKYKINALDMTPKASPAYADALDAAALALETEARRLRSRAESARQLEAAARQRNRRLDLAREIARAAIQSGASLPAASFAIMRAKTGLPDETAIMLATQAARALDRTQRQRRNETIMRLKLEGYSNARIAERLRMHPKSVARIVGQMRRAQRP